MKPLAQRSVYVLALLMVLSILSVNAQEHILAARHRPPGSVVTVRGIALNGSELGAIRYLQDSTAAIAVYPGGASPSAFQQVTTGQEVEVTGVLTLYQGLLELNPILSFSIASSGNPLPVPVEKEVRDLGFHDQGRLVRIPCVTFRYLPGRFEWGNHPIVTSHGDRSQVYVENSHPLIGSSLPGGTMDLIAITSYFNAPRLLLRNVADIELTDCIHVSAPVQSEISQHGFHVQWSGTHTGTGICVVTADTDEADTLSTGIVDMDHGVWIEDLEPARLYQIAVGVLGVFGDTAWHPGVQMSTSSASPGTIDVYFNNPVNITYSNGALPHGTSFSAMLESVKQVISNAQYTIDVAMYNSNRADIIQELQTAVQRGVRVRFIADGDQSNGALNPPPTFPLMYRYGDGIMHHKFILADVEDAQLATVWTGSTNHSTGQIATDPNNTLVIRDQALARAYLMEFEEMWGSNNDIPDPSMSRTGGAKQDDTPHFFQIGGRNVECYFSPSDHTHHEILAEIGSAVDRIDVALLLLTRYDLAESMAQVASDGKQVRVIVNDREGSLVPLQILEAGGARIAHHDFNSIFHHKYAVIDEGLPSARVITGSHNWTTSAAVRNDENTLIVHDPDIANIYRQEFEARWAELVISRVLTFRNDVPMHLYPNPAGDWIEIDIDAHLAEIVILSVTGHPVLRQTGDVRNVGLSSIVAGVYVLEAHASDGGVSRQAFIRL